MNRVRPIAAGDLDALLELARTAGTGFTSLPPVREVLAKKIARSQASFSVAAERPGPERYMFVLEDGGGDVLGCCAIEAACGLDEPFYNYHVGLTVQASPALKVYKRLPTLYLSNDLTGTSMLCSLYLRKDARRGGNGALL
ncbi:MAG TPA: arginine N-succinyltransferase, partial [Solimonas sp.]|nr:arginine N-succinyltransferase [Solimonas sp.]